MCGAKIHSKGLLAFSALILAVLLCCPLSLLAAGAGHGGHHETSFFDTIPLWKNFLFFAAIVFYGINKLVAGGWPARRERILSEVEAGREELEGARLRLNVAREQLTVLESEQKAIQDEISRDAENEFKRTIEEAHERAGRVAAQATSSIQAERKVMETTVRLGLAELVVERARKRLETEIDQHADAGLRSSALAGLGQLIQ